MKCPSCRHVSDTVLLKCGACGQAYDRDRLETFQHLEYLLAWLDERATTLAPGAHERLRDEALSQLAAVRDALGLALAPPPRAPAEIAPELALVEAALKQVWSWSETMVITGPSVQGLRRILTTRADELRAELAGRSVKIEPVSALDVLDFAIESLPSWAEDIPLSAADVASLREHLIGERAALVETFSRELALVTATRQRVHRWVRGIGIDVSTFGLLRHLRTRARKLEAELGGRSVEIEPPSALDVLDFALESMPVWAQELGLRPAEVEALRDYLTQRRRALLEPAAPAPAAVPAAPPVAEPAPVAPFGYAQDRPPPPSAMLRAGPELDRVGWWERAWSLVVSGTLLRGLLYLGAFMIVVATAVLVVRYWNDFPDVVQLAFIAAVPTAFYANGFVLRAWFKAPVAGGVFIGIGALLVAVDFAAVYQFGGLAGQVDPGVYWLGASLFCTLIYVLTAWRLPTEFFGYVTLSGVSSTLLAFAYTLRLPLEWEIAALTALGAAMVESSARLSRASDRWDEFTQAVWRLPHILIPLTQTLVLLVPGDAALGQMGTFLFAALGYGLLASDRRSSDKLTVVLAQASVWSSIPALGFALRATALPLEWYATAAAILAPSYLLAERWVAGRPPADLIPRRAFGVALYGAGFGLVALAVTGGITTVALDRSEAGVLALTLASLVLAWCAVLYRRPTFVLLAGGLFITPFSLAVYQRLEQLDVPQWSAWLMGAWAGLALAYLGLAVLLRGAERYGTWLNLWAHILAPVASCGLWANYTSNPDDWFAGPTLAALSGVILVYLASALIHDSGRHPALSNLVTWLPDRFAPAIFLWPLGFALPIWLAVAWSGVGLAWPWLGPALVGFALAYVGLGGLLARRRVAYRLPPHTYAYALAVIGILVAFGEAWPLLTTLLLAVGVLAALAFVYRRTWETALAASLFIWPFQVALDLSPLTPHAYSLAYALLASLGYIPLGVILDRVDRRYATPLYLIGYGMSECALVASLGGRFDLYPLDVPWVGVIVPLVVAGSQIFSAYHFRQSAFAWAAALVFPIAFWQALTLLHVPLEYYGTAWVGLAFAYLLTERVCAREQAWFQLLRWPLRVGSGALCALGLLLTADGTATAFTGGRVEDCFPLLLAQTLAVALTVLAAWLYRDRWPLYLEPWLAFFPVTLFFIGYGQRLFGKALTSSQFGIVWVVLGLAHLCVAVPLDRARVRYAHGLYLGGYALGLFAITWTLEDEGALFWTLGLGIVAAVGSAVLVHANRHRSWDDLITWLWGSKPNTGRAVIRGAFLWFAAWPFPLWCVLLLRQLGVVDRYQWLGLAAPPLLLLGLATWLRRFERTYAWPLHGAAQFYTVLGLIVSASLSARLIDGYLGGRYHLASDTPDASAFVLLQALAVVFYAASARVFQRRLFAHLAAWLSLVPYTLGWMVHGPSPTSAQFAWVWMGWAAVLLGIGLALDRLPLRYAHGPYLAGYVLGGLALLWSAQTLLTGLYTLAAAIVLAFASHVLVHFGQHRSFDDLIHFVRPLRDPDTALGRGARIVFLFFAVYAFPVWLTLLLTYHGVPLAWRGVALALVAPLYVAVGLAARRVRPTYTWPLYSAGYALTAIGAMVTFEDERLAIYTLVLDAAVYAVSAYMFQQSFWLYLSNVLVPIIALLTLHYNGALSASWVAGIFMGLAFLYFAAGSWFDRRRPRAEAGVSSWALPFLGPGYLLSALALAVASGERSLALVTYSAGVGLYALSAWAFRESVFLYPAAWLAAVPYYLALTATPLPSRWYGLGWLPLIVGYIALGRLVFQRVPLGIRNLRTALAALTHPAMPFYLLAYALSVSMMAVSWRDPLVLAWAFAAGAYVYLFSAVLFRHPAWLYPGLATAHLALAAFSSVIFRGRPMHVTALPSLGMTWSMALIGYGLSRQTRTVSRQTGFVHHLATFSWASPFLQFAAFDLLFWQAVALGGVDTTVILGVGHMALLALFATLWVNVALAYGALGYMTLALGYWLRWAGLPLADGLAWVGGVGFGLYLLAWIAELIVAGVKPKLSPLAVWPRPLTHGAIALATLAVAGTLPTVAAHTSAAAAALAFAGTLCTTIAYRERHYYLGYAGMAMLELAWVLALIARDIQQPQLYAIPAGLYFIGLGILERRRERRPFTIYVECFGLAVLLLTSFIQSLNSEGGLPYFVLLLVEALLVVWCSALRRIKIPFLIGLGTSVLNVVAQVTVLVLASRSTSGREEDPLLTALLIVLGVGLLLVFVPAFLERQRERIIARTQEWREMLEAWE